MEVPQISTTSQKRIKVRPALIADDDNDEGNEIVSTTKPSKKRSSLQLESPKLERMGSLEHLKTKQQIEDLRKEYGDSWMQGQSATKVQDVMGIQVPIKTTPFKTTEERLERMFNLESPPNVSTSEQLTSTPIQKSKLRDFGHSPAEVTVTEVKNFPFFQTFINFIAHNFLSSHSNTEFPTTDIINK